MIRRRAAERDRSGEGHTPTLGLTVQPLLPNPATPRPILTKDPCDLMPYPQSKIQIPRGGPVSRKINPGTRKLGATQHRALGAEALRSPKKQATGQRGVCSAAPAGFQNGACGWRWSPLPRAFSSDGGGGPSLVPRQNSKPRKPKPLMQTGSKERQGPSCCLSHNARTLGNQHLSRGSHLRRGSAALQEAPGEPKTCIQSSRLRGATCGGPESTQSCPQPLCPGYCPRRRLTCGICRCWAGGKDPELRVGLSWAAHGQKRGPEQARLAPKEEPSIWGWKYTSSSQLPPAGGDVHVQPSRPGS